jgi:uncharacterized protein (TIGR02145 family)
MTRLGLLIVALLLAVATDPVASKRMPDGKQWTTDNLSIEITGSSCYDNTDQNCRRYGRLYTWEAAQRGCHALGPDWRLPSEAEWRGLARRFGGANEDSKDRGKEAYTALLTGGRSGFNAVLGGGWNSEDRHYARLEAHGFYWTSSDSDVEPGKVWFYNFGKGSQALYRQPGGDKQQAISVRCVRD